MLARRWHQRCLWDHGTSARPADSLHSSYINCPASESRLDRPSVRTPGGRSIFDGPAASAGRPLRRRATSVPETAVIGSPERIWPLEGVPAGLIGARSRNDSGMVRPIALRWSSKIARFEHWPEAGGRPHQGALRPPCRCHFRRLNFERQNEGSPLNQQRALPSELR